MPPTKANHFDRALDRYRNAYANRLAAEAALEKARREEQEAEAVLRGSHVGQKLEEASFVNRGPVETVSAAHPRLTRGQQAIVQALRNLGGSATTEQLASELEIDAPAAYQRLAKAREVGAITKGHKKGSPWVLAPSPGGK